MSGYSFEYFSPAARNAVTTHATDHAKRMLHTVNGTDDVLLGLMTPQHADRGSTSVSRFMTDNFSIQLGDVKKCMQLAGIRGASMKDPEYTPGAIKSFKVALFEARRSSRRAEPTVDRMDVLIGLVKVNDVTFRRVLSELAQTHGFKSEDFMRLAAPRVRSR